MGKEKTAAGADRQLKGLSGRLKTVSDRLSAVGTTAEKAVKRVSATVSAAAARSTKQVQSVATLLEFDEINRLKEKMVSTRSSGRRKSASSGKKTGTKTKTGPSAAGAFDLDLSLGSPAKKAGAEFWAQFGLGLRSVDDGGFSAGSGFLSRVAQGISNAFGSVKDWVRRHIWEPIQSGWSGLAGVVVTIGSALKNGPGELWERFRSAWLSGDRSVGILDVLRNGAAVLWNGFSALWGSPAAGITDFLCNGASVLWANFSALWGSPGVGILDVLRNGAASLWNGFAVGWGSRAVSIADTLRNGALTLWNGFSAGWGSRAVSIVNTLKNSAASLWEQFRSGWAGRTLGLKISYNSNVGGVKKAVYRALGLSGWPRISFAARGGVFRSATLTMLGEAGTEAVVPLENNTGWMDVMAQKLGDRMGGTGGGSITVPVYIGGEKLAETVVNVLNAQTRCTGVNPLYI